MNKEIQINAAESIQEAIEEHRANHKILRKDMRKFIETNIKCGFNAKLIQPNLNHTIYDRPIGWIVSRDGKVLVQSTKGYEDNLNELEFIDLIKLFNHIKNRHLQNQKP